MKLIKLALTLIALNLLLSSIFVNAKLGKKTSKSKKQVHLVKDHNGFHSEINQIIRRNPTVTVETKLGAERLPPVENVIHASNSNTSTGYNLGSFGKTAEIVGINIFFKILF